MIGVGSALVSLLLIFVCYSLTLTAKRADENLLMICEKNQKQVRFYVLYFPGILMQTIKYILYVAFFQQQ